MALYPSPDYQTSFESTGLSVQEKKFNIDVPHPHTQTVCWDIMTMNFTINEKNVNKHGLLDPTIPHPHPPQAESKMSWTDRQMYNVKTVYLLPPKLFSKGSVESVCRTKLLTLNYQEFIHH